VFENNKPRVGYVVKRYPRYSETFIVNEILAHEEAGLEMEIFSLGFPMESHFQDSISRVRAPVNYLPHVTKPQEFWEAIKATYEILPNFWRFLSINGDGYKDVYQAIILARMIVQKNIRHLHAHFATSATTVAQIAARLTNIPYTFTAHAKDIFHENANHKEIKHKLECAKAVVTVSNYNEKFLRNQYGEAAGKVKRIYNGLEIDKFPFQTSQKNQNRIIAVGRLVEKKGFGDLIEACDILVKRGLNIDCEIIGSGDQEKNLISKINQLNLHNHVHLVGPLPQREMIPRMQSAAVFAAPCVIGTDGNRDGLPTVLLEAMALGTTCVSTDVTGIPEVIRHNDTGFIVPQNNPESLANAIQTLLKDTDLRSRLAKNARRLIETEFDIHQNSAQVRHFFGLGKPTQLQKLKEAC
jgi:colanic acid/amylovoran biosynthesis glycosyltransferase